jgi:SAM-dependent methyltransferase
MSGRAEEVTSPAGGFKDHFSGYACEYAAYRPTYQPALFELLASLPRRHGLALDCATGNGQAAVGLADRFERVVAIDASREQLANARLYPRVDYRLARAEDTGLATATVDLVCVAQALHWFDFDSFYAEVRRVLAPAGAIAAFTYDLARVVPEVDRILDRLSYEVVVAYWPPERRWVDEEYRTLPFPFREVTTPKLENEATWDLGRMLLYLGTLSAVRRYLEATGRDPIKMLQDELTAAWGDPARERRVYWPMYMRAGRVPAP